CCTRRPSRRFCSRARRTPRAATLSLHDALPISRGQSRRRGVRRAQEHAVAARDARPVELLDRRVALELVRLGLDALARAERALRSEEHTSELQSLAYLVCRLLLEKKKKLIVAEA